MKHSHRLHKFSQLNWSQRRMLFEAFLYLLAARVGIQVMSFQKVASRLGKANIETPFKLDDPADELRAGQVGWAVETLGRILPLDARCLAQAVAAKWMLQQRKLPSTLYIGVNKGQDNWLEAHAWLRCGDEVITGANQRERFKIIATFAEETA